MATIRINDSGDTTRAGHIAIALAIIGFIFYWRWNGTIAYIVSFVMPYVPEFGIADDPKVNALMVANAKATNTFFDYLSSGIADLLAFVGAVAVAIVSSLGAFLAQFVLIVLKWITNTLHKSSENQTPTDKHIDAFKAMIDKESEMLLDYIGAKMLTRPDLDAVNAKIDRIISENKIKEASSVQVIS